MAISNSISNQALTTTSAVTFSSVSAGSSAVAGSLFSYPTTASKGTLALTAIDNTGNFAGVLSNALLGQSTTWSLPDPGVSAANIAVNTGSLVSGNLVSYTGTDGLLVDSGISAASIATIVDWIPAPSSPVTASVNTGYIITSATAVTITLPVTAAVGSIVAIAGEGAGGWVLAPGAAQTIKVLGASASTSVTSAEQYDCIEVICTVANTRWVMRSSVSTGFNVV